MTQPLTLCYVADITNTHVKRWLGYFVQCGHRVVCLSDKPGELEGVRVIELPTRESMTAEGRRVVKKTAVLKAQGRKIRQALREIKPDILHGIYAYKRGWGAALSAYHPLIITLMGPDVFLPQANARNTVQYFRDNLFNVLTLRQADLITTVSDDLCTLANRVTIGRVPVELIPIGTDPELFRPDVDSSTLREQLAIPDGSFVIMSPRQITPHYNQETIVNAIPKVLKEIPNAVFILKDTYTDRITPEERHERECYVEKLKARIAELEIEAAVRWAGAVSLSNLPPFYVLADVVLSVPTSDGMPVTVFDAMACETPVIVGDLPSYNELVTHGQTGLRVPIRNSQALAQAIIKLHQHPELVERFKEESQLVLQQYGIFRDQMLRMERYYYSVVTGKPSSVTGLSRMLNHLAFKSLTWLT